jgi:acyl-CoA synthetase (AMP-forming)/AMP-acid ligase II
MSTVTPRAHDSSIDERVRGLATHRGECAFLLGARDGRIITFRRLERLTSEWVLHLEKSGVTRASRVGLSIADPLNFAVCFLAGLRAGLWVVPFDDELETASPEAFAARARRLRVGALLSDAGGRSDVSLRWLSVEGEKGPTPESFSGGGVVLASSGTTGTPKIVALDETRLLHAARLIARHNGLTHEDRGFNPLPLFHVNAEVVGLLATLVAGSSIVLDQRFHRTAVWSIISDFDVTWINAVPAIISRLIPLLPGERVAPSVRFCRSASAPLAPALLAAFEATTSIPVIESYGMTEAASQICANPVTGPRKVGSVGVAVGVDIRVSPTTDTDSPTNVVGPLEIRGASVVTAYEGPGYDDRFDEGWLRTGDIGYVDDEGYVFLVGRTDDVINRGGEKIFPREIEELLLAFPDVEMAAVVGQADDVFGQVPVAYVSLRSVDATTDPDAVARRVREMTENLHTHLTRARRPVAINIVERLPSNATGKVQRSSLRSAAPPVLFHETVG